MKVWSGGVVHDAPIAITSMSYGLHYASPCIWEGIRVYRQTDGSSTIFRLRQHLLRLGDSAKIIGIDIPLTFEEIETACIDLVKACGGGDLYMRPIVYSKNMAQNAKPQSHEMAVDIYCYPIKPLHSDKKGIKVAISSFRRGYPQFQMQAKTAANYAVLQNAKHELTLTGADDLLLVDNEGYITEATVANVWVFKNGVAMTPPNDGSILPGITRAEVSKILVENKIRVIEKRLTRADLYTADCIFLCGTYAEIVNVSEIDGRKVSEDHPIFTMVSTKYRELTRGT